MILRHNPEHSVAKAASVIHSIDPTASARYIIVVPTTLDESWSTWLDDLSITREANGHTRLCGVVRDQAALYGLLMKLRDLGLPLLSVERLEHTATDP